MKALTNYSEVNKLSPRCKAGMNAINQFMKVGFLEQEDEKYLDVLLERNNVAFLKWSHKTKSLKQEIYGVDNFEEAMKKYKKDAKKKRKAAARRAAKAAAREAEKNEKTFFDLIEEKEAVQPASPVHIPVELLAAQQSQGIQRSL